MDNFVSLKQKNQMKEYYANTPNDEEMQVEEVKENMEETLISYLIKKINFFKY